MSAMTTAVLVLNACTDSGPSATELALEEEGGHVPRPAVVRGIYVNALAAGSPSRLLSLLDLADHSVVNTFVIDVKERGEVSYASAVPLVGEIGSGRTHIADLPGLLRDLRDHGIYPIARIVCFLDPILAEAHPEWAIRTTDGEIWLDPESNRPWVDPYNSDVWAYNIALAREALAAGFAEVQWDYVRFPDVADSTRATMVFPARRGRSAADAIQEFIAASRLELDEFQAPITADVFGRVITATGDAGIGQDWDQMVRVIDVLLPWSIQHCTGPEASGCRILWRSRTAWCAPRWTARSPACVGQRVPSPPSAPGYRRSRRVAPCTVPNRSKIKSAPSRTPVSRSGSSGTPRAFIRRGYSSDQGRMREITARSGGSA